MSADHIVMSMLDQEVDHGTVMSVRCRGGLSRTEAIYPKTYKMICSRLYVTLFPVYQSKIASPSSRGFVVGSHCMAIVTGYALAAWTW
jgi:hypothetical protein